MPTKLPSTPVPIQENRLREIRTRHMLAEELIFKKLAIEVPHTIDREIRIGIAKDSYIFDGIFLDDSTITIVEVKYLRLGFLSTPHMYQVLQRIQNALKTSPFKAGAKFRLLLVLVSDEAGLPSNLDKVNARIDRFRSEFSFAIEVRTYNMNELKREMGVDI